MTAARTFAAVALATSAALSTAHANPKHKPTKKDPAEAAYDEGRSHYDLREWDEAIAAFKESYRLRSDERSLFNIAQAYRLKGDCVEALGFYQTYKRNFPDADGIPAVDKLLVDVEACAREKTAPPPPPAPDPAHPGTPASGTATDHADPDAEVAVTLPHDEPSSPRDSGHGMRLAGLGVAGVGVAAFAAGVAFGLSAHDKAAQVAAASGTFDPQLQADGQADDRNAKIFWVAGGAALATGVVLFVLGRSHDDAAAHVSVAPTPTGGALVWRASF